MIEGNDITKSSLALILIIAFGIFFTTDPTPTIAEDTTDKTSDRYSYDIQQQTIAIIKMARVMTRKFMT